MNVLIISNSASFPWGMASTSRVKLLSKGLIHSGNNVTYIGLKGANTNHSSEKHRKGFFEGIHYLYPGFFSVRPRNWVLRRIDDITGKLFSLMFFLNFHRKVGLDLVILYTRDYKVVKFWSKYSKMLRIKVLLELCEWPVANKGRNERKAVLFCDKSPLMVNGVLPISNYIKNEVENIASFNRTSIPTFNIPILIDIDKFQKKGTRKIYEGKYLLYAGSIQYYNIAELVINACILLKNEGYRFKLKFTGGGNSALFDSLSYYIKENDVQDMVEFTGYIQEDELISLMSEAMALLAPLPDDLQTRARFPTKIGYYLASGRPVITNYFGEVKRYLTHRKDVLFMDNFDAKSLKKMIVYVLDNRDECEQIGHNGKKLAQHHFHYANNLSGFNAFVKSIKK